MLKVNCYLKFKLNQMSCFFIWQPYRYQGNMTDGACAGTEGTPEEGSTGKETWRPFRALVEPLTLAPLAICSSFSNLITLICGWT